MISKRRPSFQLSTTTLALSAAAVVTALGSVLGCSASSEPVASSDAGDRGAGASNTDDAAVSPSGDQTLIELPGAPGDDGGGMSTSPGSDSTTSELGGFVTVTTGDAGTFEIWCGSSLCACSDGQDNDGDGVSDGFDSECTGPFDNDETTFATGIPGDNRDPKWQDCFFDGNSGAGDDDCRYHTECLTGERPPSDDDCTLTDQCVDYCAPLTPPGCDCFGCCEVQSGEGSVSVMIGSACSLDKIDDEEACPRCVQTDTCANDCGECELCLGKTLEDLPESCWTSNPPPPDGDTPDGSVTPPPGSDGGSPSPDTTGGPDEPPPGTPVNVCDNGLACTVNTDCEAGDYCRLGCCMHLQSNIR